MNEIFGINKNIIKCCLCDKSADHFRTESFIINDNNNVVSVRLYFLCYDHKDASEIEEKIILLQQNKN